MDDTSRPVGYRPGAVGTTLRYLALSLAAPLFLLPFYLIIRNGLSTEADITSPDWTLFPSTPHWENLTELFTDPSVPMARIPYRHANKVFYLIVATLMVLVIGQDESSWTVQVAISTFLTAQNVNIHELFVAAVVGIAPLVIVFAVLRRFLVQGGGRNRNQGLNMTECLP
jgi:ABC-type glycerol-3-phosphate transport system permease component